MPSAGLGTRARTVRSPALWPVFGMAVGLALLTAARPLWAQPTQPAPTGARDASAELFREGRQLLNRGRLGAACEKFRASLDLRRSPGTLLNVGNCLANDGRWVAAIGMFDEALALAAAEPDARKAAVWTAAGEQEKASLDPRIPRLTIRRPRDEAVQVTLDGRPLEAFEEPMRVDPGRHEVKASALGKQAFERQLELGEGQAKSLEIPALDPLQSAATAEAAPAAALPAASMAAGSLPAGSSPAPASDAASSRVESTSAVADSDSPRVWPWVLVGGGGVVFAGGAVTGLIAAKMRSDLEDDCPNMECENLSSARRGETTALVADVSMLAGLVAAGVGAVWLLTADDSDTSLEAGCRSGVCGAALHGRF